MSQWTAYHLSEINSREVLAVYTEKSPDGGQIFTRGYENYVKGKRVLIVGAMFFIITSALYFAAINLPLLIIIRFLHGITDGLIWIH